jgi:hypothetical protein
MAGDLFDFPFDPIDRHLADITALIHQGSRINQGYRGFIFPNALFSSGYL